MTEILEMFLEKIKEVFGNNLYSVILYGSRANGSGASEKADHNLLIIVNDLDFKNIKALNMSIPKWVRAGNNPPVIFAKNRFLKSADVFPVDFFEMKDRHEILFGADPFENLEIGWANLRHQVEFELRAKILKLTDGYMRYYSHPSKLKGLLRDSFSPLIVILRNVIRLFEKNPSHKKIELINKLGEITHTDSSVMLTLLKLKDGDRETKKLDAINTAEDYITFLEKVTDFVDSIEK